MPSRSRSPRRSPITILAAFIVCGSLLFSTAVPVGFGRSSVSNSHFHVADQDTKSLFASLLAMFQGGGGPPSVPGNGLPDLDAARASQPTEPVAPAAIASTQECTDCTPCPTCGPGSANHAPVVNGGGPYYGTAGTAIAVNGLNSFDVDSGDGISDYAWSFGDASAVVHGALPAHTYQAAGNYTVSLTVTDRHSATTTGTTTAAVTAAPPSVPPSGSSQGNGAQFLYQSLPTTMTAGQQYPVSVTMRNTGSTTWSAARLYRLGSQNPQDNGNWGRVRVSLPKAVAPSEDVTFNFTVAAPCSSCEENTLANFRWRMVQDGVEWFGDLTQNQSVTIISNYHAPYVGGWSPGPFADLFQSRIAVDHRTGKPGDDLLSRNFNWGISLAGMAGRSGLNLSIPLSYNSLAAWTKVLGPPDQETGEETTSFTFDADRGSPAAGFRLGFPTIEGPVFNYQTQTAAYLMIMPSGAHVELRQVAYSNVYEATDSSYLQLLDGGNGSLLVRNTDGTQFAYWSINDAYHCTEIKDRNGNYLTIKYDPINGVANLGRITSTIDTLGRVFNFTYDSNYRLQTITQPRSGQAAHVWASFGYSTLTLQTNFIDELNEEPAKLVGVPANHIVTVLTQVGLHDGSRYNFDYTSWGQVYKITHFAADGNPLSYTSYNLPLNSSIAQIDCPRFTQRQDWVANWNSNTPVTTTYQSDPNGTWNQVTAPDGIAYREYSTMEYTDWMRGLVTKTEIYSTYPGDNPSTPKKTTTTEWIQDLGNVPYPLNPRPWVNTVVDSDGNRRLTSVDYGAFGLPSDVFEFGPTGSSGWVFLRRTHTDYDLSEAYVNRRIIGLASGQYVFAPDTPASISTQVLMSKTTSTYDIDARICSGICATYATEAANSAIVQHDNSNYGSSFFVGRGMLTKTSRWDVTDEFNSSKSITSSAHYNVLGSLIRTSDPLGHFNTIGYTDSFSNDGTSSTAAPYVTLAYPTTTTDADDYAATARYNYDLGAVTRQQDPKGAATTTQYDSAGRVKQLTNAVNGAYSRMVYPASQTITVSATTVKDLSSEAFSFRVLDGAGRVRATASDFPDSTPHYSGQYTAYDVVGRPVSQSNPIEITSGWTATGADASSQGGFGWVFSTQSYDWKGRPVLSTNTDGTSKQLSYGGCGCAGGETVTVTDEGAIIDSDPGTAVSNVTKKRQQKIYSDALGRNFRTEVFNWDGSGQFGTGGTVYSTTVTSYNTRDQVSSVREYQGAEGSGGYRETTMTYDGYGRQKTVHIPEQKADPGISASTDHTTWEYNADNTTHSITDARGIATVLDYNGRRLLTSITYPDAQYLPTGVPATANVSYTYDQAGNRTLMSDTSGNQVNYTYNSLSQLTLETRQFAALSGSYTLAYDYTVSGQVKSVTDQSSGTSFTYTPDGLGRTSAVSSTGLGASGPLLSNIQYRASGALKHREYGNGIGMEMTYNARGLLSRYSLSGVKELNGADRAEGSDYQYHANGQVKFASDLYQRQFFAISIHDKAYQYDHAGRLQTSLSGGQANNFLNGNNPGTFMSSPPFLQTNTLDTWGNLISRAGSFWSEDDIVDPQTYDSHNRNLAWSYDADGRILSMNDPPLDELPYVAPAHTYDAAGQHTKVSQTTSRHSPSNPNTILTTVTTNTATFDGDGKQIKTVIAKQTGSNQPNLDTTWFLSSSVLDQVITELDGQGVRKKSYVYDDTGLFATSDGNAVQWRLNNPVTGDGRETNPQGKVVAATSLDPEGVDAGMTDPADDHGEAPPPQSLPHAGAYAEFLPRSFGGSGRCRLEGVEIGCGFVPHMVMTGLWGPVAKPAYSFGPKPGASQRSTNGFVLPRPANPFDQFVGLQAGPHNVFVLPLPPNPFEEDVIRIDTNAPKWTTVYWGQNPIPPPPTGPQIMFGPKFQKFVQPFKNVLANAVDRITKRKDCAKLFGGEANALGILNKTTFRIVDYGTDKVWDFDHKKFSYSVKGAVTYKDYNVFINESGPFFKGAKISFEGGNVIKTMDSDTGLDGEDLAALILLHELGHEVKWGPDAGIGDKEKNQQHTKDVYNACFGK